MTFDEYLNKPDPMAGFCLADAWSADQQAAARQAYEAGQTEAYAEGRADQAEDFECCGNPVVGAQYMGQQEMVCCGNPEPKGVPATGITERRLRQLIGKASFSSQVDRVAALTCVDVLVQAITSESASAQEAAPAENYIGWARWTEAPNGHNVLRLCDSDAPGAFKVYRAAPHAPAPVQAAPRAEPQSRVDAALEEAAQTAENYCITTPRSENPIAIDIRALKKKYGGAAPTEPTCVSCGFTRSAHENHWCDNQSFTATPAPDARAALAELVAVKDLKDSFMRLKQRRAVVFGRDPEAVAECERIEADYKRRQPLAWEAARKALAP